MSSDTLTDVLELFVAEEIKLVDIPPGGSAPATTVEEKQIEFDQRIEAATTEVARLRTRYVAPHKTKSRWVTAADIPLVVEDGKDMVVLCDIPIGITHGAKAIAHSQISTNPLRFFVFPNGKVIINPVIINHTKTTIERTEGCMSYPNNKSKTLIPRYNKVDVIYQTLGVKRDEEVPSLTEPITETLNGEQAHIFQHELHHINGVHVYDDDYTPETSAGLNDGKVWTMEELKALYI